MKREVSSPCPLWVGGQAHPTTGDYDEIDNPRAGGLYRISGSARAIYDGKKSPTLAAKLTTWIIDSHRSGERCPMIDSNVLAKVNARERLTYSRQIQRFFEYLAYTKFRVGEALSFVFDELSPANADLAAWLECQDHAEVCGLIRLLAKEGLVEFEGPYLRLMPAGFHRLEQIQSTSRDSLQAFVAMWFDDDVRAAFESGIEPAIIAAGYRAMRIDRKEHNNKIDDEIVAEIRRSKFIIADFTCGKVEVDGQSQAIARGGVYFEAGFAMGVGIPVIWTCRKDMIANVHFDTRQFSHIAWEDPDELRRALYNRIRATIGELPDAPGLP